MLKKTIVRKALRCTFLLAAIQVSLTSMTEPTVMFKSAESNFNLKYDPPQVGQNIKNLEGKEILPFDLEKIMAAAKDIPSEVEKDALAGNVCVGYWEDNDLLCRYLVFFDCFTGSIIWASQVP